MSRKDQVVPCEATSELQVKYCLTRRGLALEQGNVMSFENHEKWAEKLFASRLNLGEALAALSMCFLFG